MLRSVIFVAAAAGLLAVGALSAVAGNSHGKASGTLATSTTLKGHSISAITRATGELQSSAARLNANDHAAPAATQAQPQTQPQAQVDNESETADEASDADDNEATDEAAPAAAAAPARRASSKGPSTTIEGFPSRKRRSVRGRRFYVQPTGAYWRTRSRMAAITASTRSRFGPDARRMSSRVSVCG